MIDESQSAPAPGWFPDPAGRHQYRWWNGQTWTHDVATNGQSGVDPLPAAPTPVTTYAGADVAARVQHQVQQQAGVAPATSGGGSLFTEPVLVVNQKAKLIELTNEYAVFDQHGTQLGAVRQVGQSTLRKAVRLLSNIDQFLSVNLQVVDPRGQVLLALHRPAKLLKSTVQVTGGDGRPIGAVVQENAIGKIRFALMSGEHRYGTIQAENWRAWNFSIRDHTDTEVARITKTWEGLGKALFTTADNYVVQFHQALAEPLRSLVVASALCVDTALKQDSN